MAGIPFRKEDIFKKCASCICAPTTSFQTIYLILFHHLMERSQTIPCVIDKILQACIRVQKYLENAAFIPSAVSDWNNLNNNMREINTYVSFRSTFKNDVLGTTHVPSYFLKGQRRWAVLHERLRNNCSDLKSNLFQNHLTNSLSSSCGSINENTIHYFFECENNSNASTRKYHPPSLNTLLFGKPTLSVYLKMKIFFFFWQSSSI